MSCKHCLTDIYIIDDYSNGCVLCTNCGLVDSSFLCLDEAVFDKSTEHMSHSITSELDAQFQLSTAKMKTQSNVSFFSCQDPHTLKLMNFNRRFERIFQATQLHESVSTDAKLMYLDFEKKQSLKGRNLDFMICAFIFIVCQKKDYAMNIKLFGEEFTTDIMKCVKFIEEKNKVVNIVKEKEKVFHDNAIESFIRKYSKIVNINRKMTQEIVKLIPKAEFVMRKKEIIAIALIIYFQKNNKLIKLLAKECCISDLAIKSALRDLNNNKIYY
jgi:transcription initiation factor TFIIIB Brf1 subunit/transcription initiation factor TFIIB